MARRCLVLAFLVLGLGASPGVADDTLLPANRPVEEVIDHYINARLKEENITPAPAAPAAELIRRLTLDLDGRIPTVAETDRYLADVDPQKKTPLVDRLLGSGCFLRHQAQEFTALLQTDDGPKKGAKKSPLQDYLLRSFTENRPWDRIFRDVLLPNDDSAETKGASEFIKTRVKDLNRLTIDVSTIFFGVNVSCAQCHDHPHVLDWTQDHFYGMKSFFARTFDSGGIVAEYDAGVVKYIPNKGKEKVAPAMFLTGKTLELPNQREPDKEDKKKALDRVNAAKKAKTWPAAPEVSARAKLVETALEPGQREFFARAIVNRLLHRYYGRGLVMPLDQMHSANPPSHPELLAWLSRDLTTHGYDLRRLIRGLVLSGTYARSSRWDGPDPPRASLFAVAVVRPLTPMQLATSLLLATADPVDVPPDFQSAQFARRIEACEESARALAHSFMPSGGDKQIGASEAPERARHLDRPPRAIDRARRSRQDGGFQCPLPLS
jgi:Protein of unknown function (DUF1549)/Protein of unknown function (DUF1553)